MDAPTRTDPPYVPIRTNRWAPHQKAPRWLLLAGALIVVGVVLVALVHKPSHTQQASDLKGFLSDVNTDIESCSGGVAESLQRPAPDQRGRELRQERPGHDQDRPVRGATTAHPPTTSSSTTSPSTR